jgi:hypothetical protein
MMEQGYYEDNTNNRLNDIDDVLVEVRSEMKAMSDKLNMIYTAVVGNAELDQMGLIGRIKKLEENSETIKEFKNKIIGLGAGAGIFTASLFEIFKHYMFK